MNWEKMKKKLGKNAASEDAVGADPGAGDVSNRSLIENKLQSMRESFNLWFRSKNSKERTRIMMWTTFTVCVLLSLVILKGRGKLSENSTVPMPVKQEKVEVQLDATQAPEIWQAGAANDVGLLKAEVAALKTAMAEKNERGTPEADTIDLANPQKAGDKSSSENNPAEPKEDLPVKSAYPEAPNLPGNGMASPVNPGQFSTNGLTENSERAQNRTGSVASGKLIHMDMDSGEQQAADQKKKDKSLPVKDMIPVGTFFRATLINGLDVGTGMKALKQPQPAILRADDLSFMPNNYRKDLQGCVMTGEAAGSLSDERANIRVNHLSCIKKNGELIDQDITAFISGEDGKLGLRGKIVSKQGIYLARALMAAFAKGAAEAFKQDATTVMLNPFGGQTKTVEPSQAFRAGVGSGVGDAVERLADMYMKYAEEIFPVIEINPGRTVHVVFLQKAEITPKEKLWE